MSTKRDFLDISDWTREELTASLDLARRIKSGEVDGSTLLAGKSLAMIFRKSSTRTRVSFEVGMTQLGGHALFISDRDSQMGRGESIGDTAGVLAGYVDGVMIRTFAHEDVTEMAAAASIPIINGLTDLLHPCQIMADMLTIQEEFGPDIRGKTVAWIGDGNNMANSWLNAAYRMGFSLRVACPEGYDPDPAILERARGGADILLTRDPAEAAEGADVLTTDVWASMGQEEEAAARMEAFKGFCVDNALMGRGSSDAIFLHCLPAHRGEEVAAEVIDGPRSRIFPEAENRLHAQKSIMVELLG
ncbi:MAG: ornithine carbamoyltransferase [Planctomycetota bacterium]|jgi:ornithine carbamoyltransferase